MGYGTRVVDIVLMFALFTPFIALYKKTGNELMEDVVLNRTGRAAGAWVLLALGVGVKVALLTLRHALASTVLAVSPAPSSGVRGKQGLVSAELESSTDCSTGGGNRTNTTWTSTKFWTSAARTAEPGWLCLSGCACLVVPV